MSIQPEGEAVRMAVKWISAEKKADPQKALSALIRQAALQFDLTPKDNEFLIAFYKENDA